MALVFNQRHLEKENLHLRGEIAVDELELVGLDECIRVSLPLKHELEVQLLEGSILVQGRLQLDLDCTCVRCLKSFWHRLELNNWVCHLARTGEDKVRIVNDCIDLTPYVREDILLAFPQHPLCEPGCDGLSVHQSGGANLIEAGSSAWAALNKLKF
jgi:uncharacterized protein